jgi:hypothetical protein
VPRRIPLGKNAESDAIERLAAAPETDLVIQVNTPCKDVCTVLYCPEGRIEALSYVFPQIALMKAAGIAMAQLKLDYADYADAG